MRILLVGEYSTLHTNLKEGLINLGHDVTLVGDGDGFKNLTVDVSYRATFSTLSFVHAFTKGIFKLCKVDLTEIERGMRFWFQTKHLKNFDIVQLINERPIKTLPHWERSLLKKLFCQNKTPFLLSCGVDHLYAKYLFENPTQYSLLQPFLNNKNASSNYMYVKEYLNEVNKKTHEFVFKNIKGVIASDLDYVAPLKNHPKFLGLIPNPINLNRIEALADIDNLKIEKPIIIFHGINQNNYYKKGNDIFDIALDKIQKKYPGKVKTIVVRNLPYQDYLKAYTSAHILLDQIYAYDQGYNALEAMVRGKVVFTGAEQEFLDHYGLQADEVCINALPDVDYLVEKISMLIENPEKIKEIGRNARTFIEREHHYIKIAERYLETWLKT